MDNKKIAGMLLKVQMDDLKDADMLIGYAEAAKNEGDTDVMPISFLRWLFANAVLTKESAMEQFRCFVYRGCLPDLRIFVGGSLIAVVMFLIGLLVFKKTQDKFILYI